MQDVVREAQISRAATYICFESKREVFNGVIEFFLSVIVQSSVDALEEVGQEATIHDKIFAVFDSRQRLWLGLAPSQKSTFYFELVKNHQNYRGKRRTANTKGGERHHRAGLRHL